MHKTYSVTLTDAERADLKDLIAVGKGAARRLAHARMLLKADQGLTDAAIAAAVEVRVAQPSSGSANASSRRVSTPPWTRAAQHGHGQAGWTLRLLANQMVELAYVDARSHETVRRTLKKTSSSRGASASG